MKPNKRNGREAKLRRQTEANLRRQTEAKRSRQTEAKLREERVKNFEITWENASPEELLLIAIFGTTPSDFED